MFRNRFKVLGVLVLLVFALTACGVMRASSTGELLPAAGVIAAAVESQNAVRAITVVGVGKVTLVPDIARIEVGAEARAESVSEAKAEVDAKMTAITAALKELGIADRDIQTTYYSIFFEQEPTPIAREGEAGETRGMYRVSNMVQVTARDVAKAGEVLDAVVEAGANQVYGVNLTISERELWEGQAREKAIADAQARAQDLARLAGVELGEVLSVSEVIGGAGYVPAMAERGLGGGGISPGELEMSTQVQVTFAIQ